MIIPIRKNKYKTADGEFESVESLIIESHFKMKEDLKDGEIQKVILVHTKFPVPNKFDPKQISFAELADEYTGNPAKIIHAALHGLPIDEAWYAAEEPKKPEILRN